MVVIGRVSCADWCSDIIEKLAPRDAVYFSLIASGDQAKFDLAHDAMLGLTLTGKGSGVLTIKEIDKDFFFDQPMVGFFV